MPVTLATHMRDVVSKANSPQLQVELGGSMFTDQTQPSSEAIGIVAAIVILLLAFGSLLAMGLPIMTALFGIGIGLALVTLLARFIGIPSFAPEVTAMIGIGVGIDYALFISTRYREALHEGADPERAVVHAIDTSGRAVLFVGGTVVISLLGLFVIGVSFIRGLAIGAALAVLFVMAAAVTLLPAVLGFVGHTIDKFALPNAQAAPVGRGQLLGAVEPHAAAPAVGRGDRRAPDPPRARGAVLLVAPRHRRRRQRSDEAHDAARPTTSSRRDSDRGSTVRSWSPATPPRPTCRPRTGLRADCARDRDVAQVSPVIRSAKGVLIQVVAEGIAARREHHRARAPAPKRRDTEGDERHRPPRLRREPDRDRRRSRRHARSRLPYMFLAILLMSFVLLMVVFRSLLVPLKAVIMNLLSIGAAYGVIVAIFQWGWLARHRGHRQGGPDRGLGADDAVRDRVRPVDGLRGVPAQPDQGGVRRATGDNVAAVAHGLAKTARLITAAAAIMICVFASFVLSDLRVLKLVGFGLAFAVLVDATLVRLVLVPATMELLGDRNWWLPKWLEWLPRGQRGGGARLHRPHAGRT